MPFEDTLINAWSMPEPSREALGATGKLANVVDWLRELFGNKSEVTGGSPLTTLGDPGIPTSKEEVGLAVAGAFLPSAVRAIRKAGPIMRELVQESKLPLELQNRISRPPPRLPSITDLINDRSTVYHATDLQGAQGILEAGEISPNPWLHQGLGTKKQKELMKTVGKISPKAVYKEASVLQDKVNSATTKFHNYIDNNELTDAFGNPLYTKIAKDSTAAALMDKLDTANAEVGGFNNKYGKTPWEMLDEVNELVNPETGVSVSRIPRVASKSTKAISFELDREKMPSNRPLAEEGYRKTLGKTNSTTWWDYATPEELALYNSEFTKSPQKQAIVSVVKSRIPNNNPHFEFEDRTFNQSIPTSAVKRILVDAEALGKGSINRDIVTMYAESHKGFNDWVSKHPVIAQQAASDAKFRDSNVVVDLVDRYLQSVGPKEAAKFRRDIQLAHIKDLASAHDLPVEVYPSGRAMHASRLGTAERFTENTVRPALEGKGMITPKVNLQHWIEKGFDDSEIVPNIFPGPEDDILKHLGFIK